MITVSNTNPQAVVPADPSLRDLLDLLKKDIMLSLSAHHIGSVQSFDPSTQTATATINYKKTYTQLNKTSGLYEQVLVDYPILIDCPVVCLGGGPASLTFPIAKGDECLVIFNDRDMDNWFQGGSGGQVATPRLHSFSDGIILVGIRSMGNVLGSYDSTRAIIQNGTTFIGIGSSLIKLANQTTTLNTLLQSLITQIKAITVDVGGIGPAQGLVSATSQAALLAVANQISGLLE